MTPDNELNKLQVNEVCPQEPAQKEYRQMDSVKDSTVKEEKGEVKMQQKQNKIK
jgi:hypothetical protein